jgi:hypothetical protein
MVVVVVVADFVFVVRGFEFLNPDTLVVVVVVLLSFLFSACLITPIY